MSVRRSSGGGGQGGSSHAQPLVVLGDLGVDRMLDLVVRVADRDEPALAAQQRQRLVPGDLHQPHVDAVGVAQLVEPLDGPHPGALEDLVAIGG